MARLLVATLITALAALGSTANGSAKGFPLIFDPETAAVGDAVTALALARGFYVNQPQYQTEYGVRGPMVLRVRAANHSSGRLLLTVAVVAAAGAGLARAGSRTF